MEKATAERARQIMHFGPAFQGSEVFTRSIEELVVQKQLETQTLLCGDVLEHAEEPPGSESEPGVGGSNPEPTEGEDEDSKGSPQSSRPAAVLKKKGENLTTNW